MDEKFENTLNFIRFFTKLSDDDKRLLCYMTEGAKMYADKEKNRS